MQFRIQGKKLQCIRSTYDPSVKRCTQKVVFTLPIWADSFISENASDLTDVEREELTKYLENKKVAKDQDSLLFSLKNAACQGGYLPRLAEAIERFGDDLDADQADLIWDALAVVGKALKNAGHQKPKSKRREILNE